MDKKCWICGKESDSGEHKFKASDLKRNYGKNFSKHNLIYFSGKDEGVNLESYKSKELIFPKVICITCNVKTTRPHDDAYDAFVKYIESNYNFLFAQKNIDFEIIYGANWEEEKLNLYRYFAKHAGCKIVTSNKPYDLGDLAKFILGKSYSENFHIHFQLKEGIHYMVEKFNEYLKYAHVYNSSTSYFGNNIESLSFCGWTSYQWISTNWIVSNKINKSKTDLTKRNETLQIKFLEHCKPFIETMTFDDLLTNIELQGIETLEERTKFFIDLIK